jgi:hypothetical protein
MNIISSIFTIILQATLQGILLMSQGQTLSLRLITEYLQYFWRVRSFIMTGF